MICIITQTLLTVSTQPYIKRKVPSLPIVLWLFAHSNHVIGKFDHMGRPSNLRDTHYMFKISAFAFSCQTSFPAGGMSRPIGNLPKYPPSPPLNHGTNQWMNLCLQSPTVGWRGLKSQGYNPVSMQTNLIKSSQQC